MNILSNMDEIADIIIRPNRYVYKTVDLGPKLITHDSLSIFHHDFEVRNNRGLLLKASLYTTSESLKDIKRVIVYLHCNSGCRIEGLSYMKMAIANQFAYVVFDFAGSGISEGKYVSLGYYEVEDIKSVLKHLRKRIGDNIKIVLWGRSMGAVAALRYLSIANNQKLIQVAVLDSPFYCLKDLFIEIGKERTNLPKIVLEVAMKYLKPIVEEKAKFNIDDVNLADIDKITECPGIFIASKNDSLIPFSQMDKIFKEFNGQKEMLFVEETHNEPRNPKFIAGVFETMCKYFESSLIIEEQHRSQLASKDASRKKLQLTIKSLSQKTITLSNRSSETPRKCLKQISFPCLEKRQISCLFGKKKKSINSLSQEVSEDSISLNNYSIGGGKKNQIIVRKFFKDDNISKEAKAPNVIKFKFQKQLGANEVVSPGGFSRDKERKTMQHIASKKPPFIESNKLLQFRNSLESKYKTESKHKVELRR